MPDRQPWISALLPVHRGVAPEFLAAAIESVMAQTRPVDELVVVEDGPLDPAHIEVLDAAEHKHVHIVRERLAVNQGAGVANQAGLLRCRGTWILKVDADDLSAPERVERLLTAVGDRRLDVCGSAMLEFDHETASRSVLRMMPLDHQAIQKRMPVNNPFNHPSIMYRRDLALQAGGYPAMRFMQDYVLVARMAKAGARMGNLPDPLVHFRAGAALHVRRADPRFAKLEKELQVELRRAGVVGPVRARINLVLRRTYRRLPVPVTRLLHRHVLSRSRAQAAGAIAAAPTIPITSEVVARQVAMAVRSAKAVVRRPSVAREFPRLLETRGRNTVRLRLPWLPFRLIDELEQIVGPGSKVFEYGGGGSTLWFLDRGAEVVTVEHHDAWADTLESYASASGWTLLRASAEHEYAEYVAAVDAYPKDHFDVVLVDGRERARCLLAAASRVRPGGMLILDDSDRERYTSAAEQVPWPREQVVGFAPAKPTLAYTTVFRKPLE